MPSPLSSPVDTAPDELPFDELVEPLIPDDDDDDATPPDDPPPADDDEVDADPLDDPLPLDDPAAPDDPPPESTEGIPSESDPLPEFAHPTHDTNPSAAAARTRATLSRQPNR